MIPHAPDAVPVCKHSKEVATSHYSCMWELDRAGGHISLLCNNRQNPVRDMLVEITVEVTDKHDVLVMELQFLGDCMSGC